MIGRIGIGQQAGELVVGQNDRVKIVGEPLGVEIGSEVTLFDRDPGGGGQCLEPVLLGLDYVVSQWPRLIIDLHGGGDKWTTPGKEARSGPREPILEKSPDAGLPAWLEKGRRHDSLDEELAGGSQYLELQGLLGPEVSEQAALRHVDLFGQVTDAQTGEPAEAGFGQRRFKDLLTSLFSLIHENIIERSCFFVKSVYGRIESPATDRP